MAVSNCCTISLPLCFYGAHRETFAFTFFWENILENRLLDFLPTGKSPYHTCRSKGKAVPYRPRQAPSAPGAWGFKDVQTIGTWMWQGCQSYAPATCAFPQAGSMLLISVWGWVEPRTMMFISNHFGSICNEIKFIFKTLKAVSYRYFPNMRVTSQK